MIRIKNCGMHSAEAIDCALQSGAEFIGFIHYPASRRYISFKSAAALAERLSEGSKAVAVLVNPSDEEIHNAAAYADMLQLHGDETPERVAFVKALSGKPIIKAIGIGDALDVMAVGQYDPLADMLLLDTKHAGYGGSGERFDWSLLAGVQFHKPWFLSGGLDAGNVVQALRISGAGMVDVCSGIEREAGVKDLRKIEQFNEAVRNYAGE